MALTTAQKNHLITMDRTAKELLAQGQGGQAALLLSICDKIDLVKEIVETLSEEALAHYCQCYPGFHDCMSLIDQLTLGESIN